MNKLDLKTKLFLFITGATIEKEKKYTTRSVAKNVVYVFDSYDEFKNYFSEHVNEVKEDVINSAIYTRSTKGAIVAFKGLCDHIITKAKFQYDIKKLTQEEIDAIHKKGKITQLEKVKEWESHGLCAPGDAIGSAADRCAYFKNCHECLLEFASHQLEHDPFDFKLVRLPNNEEQSTVVRR